MWWKTKLLALPSARGVGAIFFSNVTPTSSSKSVQPIISFERIPLLGLHSAVLGVRPLPQVLFNQVRYAGHNKWSNIKHTKGARDLRLAKLFGLYGHKIRVAIKESGGNTNPETNYNLKKLFAEALAQQVPKATLEKIVKGAKTATELSEFLYEVRGPGRVAILVELLAKNKAMCDIMMATILRKHASSQERGVVNMFQRKGVIISDIKSGTTFDDAESDGIEVGAEEVNLLEDDETNHKNLEFIVDPYDLAVVKGELVKAGYTCQDANISYIPTVIADLNPIERNMLEKMLVKLNEEDIVTAVHTNAS